MHLIYLGILASYRIYHLTRSPSSKYKQQCHVTNYIVRYATWLVTWPLIGHRENSLQVLTVHDGRENRHCIFIYCFCHYTVSYFSGRCISDELQLVIYILFFCTLKTHRHLKVKFSITLRTTASSIEKSYKMNALLSTAHMIIFIMSYAV